MVTKLVSVSSAGVSASGHSSEPDISGDGRYVAFVSEANNLVPGDTNNAADIFIHDRQTQTTERVSVGPGGVQGNAGATTVSISADGRYVAFASTADNFIKGDKNRGSDVFVYDRQLDTLKCVSVTTKGKLGKGESYAPHISDDGQTVTFTSSSVLAKKVKYIGVYTHDMKTGITEYIGPGDRGTLSKDGKKVSLQAVFEKDGAQTQHAIVYDRSTKLTELASATTAGEAGNSQSGPAIISADGRYVAFSSFASNLAPGDNNFRSDVFIYDLQTKTLTGVTANAQGLIGNDSSNVLDVSEDGRFVLFSSNASNLAAGDLQYSGADAFVFDSVTGQIAMVSLNDLGFSTGGVRSGKISSDGKVITFSVMDSLPGGGVNPAQVYVTDNPFGRTAIQGGSTNDALLGGAERDTLIGGGGNDRLDGAANADFMYGELGNDVYVVESVSDFVLEKADEGIDTVESSISYKLGAHLENITLTGSGNVNATGNAAANTIIGNSGGNSLSGGDGNDYLDGGAGLDALLGGKGDDVFIIHAGDEAADFDGEGYDKVFSSASFQNTTEIEEIHLTGYTDINATGSPGHNDFLIGNSGNNILDGRGGFDRTVGGAGNDTHLIDNLSDTVIEVFNGGIDTVNRTYIFQETADFNYTLPDNVENYIDIFALQYLSIVTGNNLDNTFTGHRNNTFFGLEGNDTFKADKGTFTGGEGSDIFHSGVEVYITDFETNVDSIALNRDYFAPGFQMTSEAFVEGSEWTNEQQRVRYDPSTGKLYANSNYNPLLSDNLVGELQTGLDLSHLDFIVV